MSSRIEQFFSALVSLSAVAIAVSVVVRTLGIDRPLDTARQTAPTYHPEWRSALRVGHVSGDTASASIIVVFEDLECPMCRVFDRTLESVTSERSDIAVVHVPFPLDMHRFALPAARAAACAELADSSRQFAKVVYANQDSIGLKSWESLAREAGISDTTLVGRCARNPTPVHRVEEGIALGERLGVSGTPTVLVNGWMLHGRPSEATLRNAIAKFRRAPR